MENREFDHIEDSLRKAFDGFELSVNDTDWLRIAAALPETSTKRRGIFWLNNSKKLGLIVLIAILGGGSAWYFTSDQVQNVAGDAERAGHIELKERQASGEEQTTGFGRTGKTSTGNLGGIKAGPHGNALNYAHPQTGVAAGNSTTGSGSSNNIGGNTGSKPKTEIPVASNPLPDPAASGLKPEDLPKPFGVRHLALQWPSLLPALAKLELRKSAITPDPKPGITFYSGLHTTFAPGNLSVISGTADWDGFNLLSGNNRALNMRLEGGIEYGTNTLFTVGAALEGNAMGSGLADTVKLKVATRYLPYYDQNMQLLYMLAVKWRDTVIVIQRNPQRVWAEIPLGLRRYFESGNNRLSVGITANPGILLGSNGSMANPFVYQSGSYWSHHQGVNRDTTSMVISEREFLNPVRMGTGIQLGAERSSGNLTFGIHAQTRYYFTPTFKPGVPMKENTIQYGIQLRLGIKI